MMSDKFSVVGVIFALICCNCMVSVQPAALLTDHETEELKWKSVLMNIRQWKSKVQMNFGDLSQLSLPSELIKHFDSEFINQFTENYFILKSGASRESSIQCLACKLAVRALQKLLRLGVSYDEIGKIVTIGCQQLKVEKPDVCVGIVNSFKEEVLYVLSHISDTPESVNNVCGVVVDDSCFGPSGQRIEWNITLPNVTKPPIIAPVPPKKESPKLKVLHLTDIHLDLLYRNGTDADCGKPLCCHDADLGGGSAGYWGDYGTCDIPLQTIEELFKNLSRTAKFDYILWTGDVASHLVWNETRASLLYQLETITQLFLKYFPKTPVYCAVGNHESNPVNSFPPPFIKGNMSISWLYDGLRSNWLHWLPEHTSTTISKGGYYTVLVHPGFRIISLNNIYCISGDWWLFMNSTDPADELSWLVEVLQKAEADGEKVHIIGHIPPGASDCLKTWSWNYYQIVNRYEGTIAAQFFGHKHFDLWEIFYDKNDFKRPVSVAYVAPSLTTYVHLNPGYRIYEIDGFYAGSSWMVLDHDTFIMNLTETNIRNEPVWRKEYSAKLAYNMTSLTPKDWNDVTQKLLTDKKMFKMYREFYYNSNSHQFPPCDKDCLKHMICELRSGLSHDLRPCKDLVDLNNEKDFEHSFYTWLKAKSVC